MNAGAVVAVVVIATLTATYLVIAPRLLTLLVEHLEAAEDDDGSDWQDGHY